jgi:chromate transporter
MHILERETPPPSLGDIARVFLAIGLQSFGGGMTAWIRRETVTRRGWMTEQQFVGGLALAQIAPGANGVNLAVFVGGTLRGVAGALAALSGMLLAPVALILALGAVFARVRAVPGVEAAMAGLGATAIGLNASNGLRLTRRNIRTVTPALVMFVTAASVGLFGLPLLPVLLLMLPISLILALRA